MLTPVDSGSVGWGSTWAKKEGGDSRPKAKSRRQKAEGMGKGACGAQRDFRKWPTSRRSMLLIRNELTVLGSTPSSFPNLEVKSGFNPMQQLGLFAMDSVPAHLFTSCPPFRCSLQPVG